MPNPSQSWSYDAAGNRGDAVVDSLNRMTVSTGFTYTNYVLRNRTFLGQSGTGTGAFVGYSWDCLSRMTGYAPNMGGRSDYAYRADGMRVTKTVGNNNHSPVTL